MRVGSLLLQAFAAAAVVMTSGCQATGPEDLVASNAPAEISGPAASAIAGDMVSRFAEQIGPGKATVALKPDGSPFGQALEAALKGWGYSVVTDQKTDDKAKLVAIAYALQPYEDQVLARLSTATVDIGRAYTVTEAGATPASPLSVMRKG
ncbi:conjugal transfer protein TrbH [Sinorhizobium saheli]|uniref:Conjugal transfer protein TrbH n=1 Tax=Sinorhizobium saheli TaxID=36856 RepID=A0A178YQW7_SINSA|nr:conjugal transfer protein TrbH [Sinorhizobium saheli]MQW86126.1 conjugal transfer protein TrbH [Sinorhizobium saheli]OAP49958.1 conjugal transfer protein TrbH [Sinorhizobium saheli]